MFFTPYYQPNSYNLLDFSWIKIDFNQRSYFDSDVCRTLSPIIARSGAGEPRPCCPKGGTSLNGLRLAAYLPLLTIF
jgi:hypothetical protein